MKLNTAAGIILMVLAFTSCKSLKEFKDNRSMQRVTASRPLLDKVKPYVDSLWPCKIDTSIVYKPGRVDTVSYKVVVPVLDTARQRILVDSIVAIQQDCKDVSDASYAMGWTEAATLVRAIKVIHSSDTFYITKTEQREVSIANEARLAVEYKLRASEATAAVYKKSRNNLYWVVSGLILLIGIGIFLKVRKFL